MSAVERRVLVVLGPAAGGIGEHVRSLTAGLPEHGWRTVTFTAAATAHRFDLGPVVPGWPPPGGRPLERLRATTRAVRDLRRLARDADVVHAHGHQAGFLSAVALVGVRRRPALAVSWHNAILTRGVRRRVAAAVERVQARRADLVTGASEDLVDRARRVGARDPRLAPVAAPHVGRAAGGSGADGSAAGGVDGAVDGAAVRAELAVAGPLVLTVSRIAPQKDLETLVAAAAEMARSVPDVTWLVVGGGDEGLRDGLERRIATSGAPVRLLGFRDDVADLVAAADAFVLVSRWEARALVVQEALAAGTPVVCTAVGGLPGLVGDAGLLVPVGDPGAVAAAVGRVLVEPELAADLSARGLARAAELPSEADVVAQWATTYGQLAPA